MTVFQQYILDLKYDIFKHPNFSLTEDGGAKPYIHNPIDEDTMTISFPNMSLKNIDSIEVDDYGFELVADIDLEIEFEMEENSNEKTK